jgi:ferrochelatase
MVYLFGLHECNTQFCDLLFTTLKNNRKPKTGLLLLNLGTPDSPKVSDVRRYLSQFLNDPRVIDIPWLLRKILVNLIIVPFRAPKSAKIYQELWTDRGSPLLIYGNSLKEKMQKRVGENVVVELAMRYQQPAIKDVLERMRAMNLDRIIVFPLFPQYASSSTGSALQEVMEVVKNWWVIPELKIFSQYFDHPLYLETVAGTGKEFPHENYDHVIFSYHGLPERHVDKVYEDRKCSNHACEDQLDNENYYCYKAGCYYTTSEIVRRLNIPEGKYTVSFQSRLDNKWLKPYSDEVVQQLAEKGAKNILVFSPAFTADCLETTIEIGHEYFEIFTKAGGKSVQLVPSLNDRDEWVETIYKLAFNE